MKTAAPRPPLRRWFYAAYLTMRSVEPGMHHAALRSARATGRFVCARLWVSSTRFAPCRTPVAPVLDHQRRSDAMGLFEKRHDTAYVRWFGPPQGVVHKPQLIGASVVLPSMIRPGDQAPPTTEVTTAGLRLDLTVAIRVGIDSVYVAIEVLARSARQSHRPRMRDSSDVAALRHLYRRWLASGSH